MSDSKEKLRELRKKLREQQRKLRDAEQAAGLGPKSRSSRSPKSYEEHRAEMSARSRARAKSGQEIGPCPPPNMAATIDGVWRREACSKSLMLHCKTYHARKFWLPWSKDLVEAAEIMQDVLVNGGKFALAMTRGGGKTSLCRAAVEWAVLNGYRRFVVFISATDPLAVKSLRAIKTNIAHNDTLFEDYPEVCFPIRCLDNNPVRARMQTCNGKPTSAKWSDDELWMPDVDGSLCAGSILYTAGITGAVRGPNIVLPNGESLRPDCVVGDDLQTRQSAKSPAQTNDREDILQGDVLELAGPDTEIALLLPGTIIYPNDLQARLLDRQRYPDFQGKTYKAVYKFPTNMGLWDEYAGIRAESMRMGNRGREATEFVAANFEAMHEGAELGWPDRVKKGDVSALQTAMNVKISKPRTFAAEWQNEPEMPNASLGELRQLTEEDLAVHQNQLPLGIVPRDCNKLTAFIDLGQEILWWMVCAWTDRFGGAIIDYGTFPDQPVQIVESNSVPKPLSQMYPSLDEKARIYAALSEVTKALAGKSYAQHDGTGKLSMSLGLVDAGKWTDTVHEFLSRSPFKALWRASRGRSIDPNSKPMNEYRKEPGDEVGWNWRVDMKTAAKGRYVSFDTRPWKSQIVNSLLAAPGSEGSPGSPAAIYLPGKTLTEHPLLALHLLAEYRGELKGSLTGRKVEAWYEKPDSRGNHFFDALVGAAVAASILKIQFSSAIAAGETPEDTKPMPTVDARAEYLRKRREFEARRGMR